MIIIPKKDGYADSLVDFIKTSENNVQLDALENRKKELELFLKEIAKRKDIESNDNFKNFLEIDKHSPDF